MHVAFGIGDALFGNEAFLFRIDHFLIQAPEVFQLFDV